MSPTGLCRLIATSSMSYIPTTIPHQTYNNHRLGYVRVNYVAAFKEIEFEFRVPPKPEAEAGAEAGTEAWRDKWRRLIVGGEGEGAVLMRRAPYQDSEGEEEGEGEGEGGTGEEEG